MFDTISDTPNLGVPWCPGCDPDLDPLVGIPDVRWCDAHFEARWAGTADAQVTRGMNLYGGGEVGGSDNRAWCNLIHRGQEPPKDSPALLAFKRCS